MKDKIDTLLDAFKKTSAKRVDKERKSDARWDAAEKARQKFEAEAKEKIIKEVRPLMKQLLARLDKKKLKVSIEEFGSREHPQESYMIKGIEEKELELWFAFTLHEEKNLLEISMGYATNEDKADSSTKTYPLKELNDALVKKTFIKGLEKICL